MGYMVPMSLQMPLDGMHVMVGVLYRLQCGCYEAQYAQEKENCFVLPYFGEGSDKS